MVELEQIIARIRVNTSEMLKGFDQLAAKASQVTRNIGEKFDALGRNIQGIGRSMLVSVSTPITALLGFSVKTASDIMELQNLISVTFGEATKDVTDWAASTAEAVQRSRFALLKAAGDFAAFLKPMGVAPDRIVPMSKALAQLTTDIASFRNISDEEAATRLFSGIAGETEAVRRLGIDLGQTAIEAELLRMGFQGNAMEATQAQKAVARFNLIINQTRDAQGDAARTAGSFENSWKGLQAVFRDVRAEIGNLLLPKATELVQKVRELGLRFLNLSTETKTFLLSAAGIAAAIGPGLIALGTLVRIIGFAGTGLVQFGLLGTRAVVGVIKAFTNLTLGVAQAVVSITASLFTLPGICVTVVAAGIAAFYVFPETLKNIFSMEALRAIFDNVRVAFQNYVTGPVIAGMNELIRQINKLPGIDFDLFETPGKAELSDRTKDFGQDLANTFSHELQKAKAGMQATLNSFMEMVGNANIKLPESIQKVINDIKNSGANLGDTLGLGETSSDLDELKVKFAELFKSFDDLGANANDNLANARITAKGLSDDLRQAFVGRLADVNSLGDAMGAVLDRLKAQVLELIFFGNNGQSGLFGGIFSQVGSLVSGFFGGGKAAGGDVSPSKGYMVGEKGPEWFQPNSAGRISDANTTKNMVGGRNIVVNQTFQFPADNSEITERMVTIGAAMRDQAISAFRQASNQGF